MRRIEFFLPNFMSFRYVAAHLSERSETGAAAAPLARSVALGRATHDLFMNHPANNSFLTFGDGSAVDL
jgi:hypothetical protein